MCFLFLPSFSHSSSLSHTIHSEVIFFCCVMLCLCFASRWCRHVCVAKVYVCVNLRSSEFWQSCAHIYKGSFSFIIPPSLLHVHLFVLKIQCAFCDLFEFLWFRLLSLHPTFKQYYLKLWLRLKTTNLLCVGNVNDCKCQWIIKRSELFIYCKRIFQ